MMGTLSLFPVIIHTNSLHSALDADDVGVAISPACELCGVPLDPPYRWFCEGCFSDSAQQCQRRPPPKVERSSPIAETTRGDR
jgi:hypothetical protein